MPRVSLDVLCRGTILLLWVLAAHNAVTCRALFWDGSAFLANILEHHRFHDFYTARAHVDWLTQLPVLMLAKWGVRDTHLLAMVYSATLFAIPTAFYHLALKRARRDAVLLAAVLLVVSVIYIPTAFFIIGEYNVAFAGVTAVAAVAVTGDGRSRGDALFHCLVGVLCLRSYEAMVYLGPLVAAIVLWSTRRSGDGVVRMLGIVAALAFAAGAVVSMVTIVDYWDHPHFMKVRSTSVDFWQNMQFAIPVAGLLICGLAALQRPAWLAGRGPLVVMGTIVVLLAISPWWRLVHAPSILYPPSHYVARQAAGILLALVVAGMWAVVARPALPALFEELRRPQVSRRAAIVMAALAAAASVPDIAMTRLWHGYLGEFRGIVDSRTGIIRAETLPLHDWPAKLFFQDWSYPSLSAVVSTSPGRSYVVPDQDYLSNPPFEPACGLLPRLKGYGWRA